MYIPICPQSFQRCPVIVYSHLCQANNQQKTSEMFEADARKTLALGQRRKVTTYAKKKKKKTRAMTFPCALARGGKHENGPW